VRSKAVVPRQRAHQDVEQAIEHYLSESAPQAASGFVDDLEEAYGHIGRHPDSGSSRYAGELNFPDLRFWPLKRYPYLVFYLERSDCIDIWRVLHAKRDIPRWMQDPEVATP